MLPYPSRRLRRSRRTRAPVKNNNHPHHSHPPTTAHPNLCLLVLGPHVIPQSDWVMIICYSLQPNIQQNRGPPLTYPITTCPGTTRATRPLQFNRPLPNGRPRQEQARRSRLSVMHNSKSYPQPQQWPRLPSTKQEAIPSLFYHGLVLKRNNPRMSTRERPKTL